VRAITLEHKAPVVQNKGEKSMPSTIEHSLKVKQATLRLTAFLATSFSKMPHAVLSKEQYVE